MKKLIIFFCLLILAAGLAGVEEGEDFPSFANYDLNKTYYFSKNLTGKWLILDFFATYCKPCKEEIPELEKIVAAYAEEGVLCLVFSIDKEGLDIVRPYFEETPSTLKVLIDKFSVTAERYGVENLPTVFLVNPEGKIVLKREGYSVENITTIKEILAENLGPGKPVNRPTDENEEEEPPGLPEEEDPT